jgi:hypothetical protein
MVEARQEHFTGNFPPSPPDKSHEQIIKCSLLHGSNPFPLTEHLSRRLVYMGEGGMRNK